MVKQDLLTYFLKRINSCAIAFSGGMDSTYLLTIANSILKDKCVAITIDTPYIPRWEIKEAIDFCLSNDINHHIIKIPIPEIIKDNPENHCYFCKKQIFENIINFCNSQNIEHIFDGSNADDLNDYRPGLKALQELKIESPLLKFDFTKADIRMFSKELNLSTWDKPPYACLLSRIPVGTEIDIKELEKIEQGEVYLMQKGFKSVRLRSHGEIARIEIEKDDRSKIFNESTMDEISKFLKSLGYKYVSLELEGYKTGSMNIKKNKNTNG